MALARDPKLLGQVPSSGSSGAAPERWARSAPSSARWPSSRTSPRRWALHPHFHVLVPEGVFEGVEERVDFVALPPPDDADVERLLRRVARRTVKLARARFPDGLPYAEDAWDLELNASAQTRLPLGEGPRPRRRRCAFFEGFSLHADTWVHPNDRDSLERLCRYGARGPLSLERLTRREDGKLEYRLKKPAPNGAAVLAPARRPPTTGTAAPVRAALRVGAGTQACAVLTAAARLGGSAAAHLRARRPLLPVRRPQARPRRHHLARRRPENPRPRPAFAVAPTAPPTQHRAAPAGAPLTHGAPATTAACD